MFVLAGVAAGALAQSGPSPDDARALLVEFLTQREKGFRARWTATGWRQETNRYDGAVPVHSLIEVSCPDAYHLRVTRGTQVTDFYSVGGIEYRRQDGHWITKPAPTGHYNGCYPQQEVRRYRNDPSPEAFAQQWADDLAAWNRVQKERVLVVHGERCQQWKEISIGRPDEGRGQQTTTYCLSLADGHTVQTNEMTGAGARPVVTVTYDWNKPITIKPPSVPVPSAADPAPHRRR